MVGNITSTGSHTDFREEVDSILSAELTPEVIDTYVDTALRNLTDVAVKASDAYVQETGDLPDNNRELEDRAFCYYGLGGIPRILGDLSSKSESIEKLRTFVDSLEIDNEVVVPPDETGLRPVKRSPNSDHPFEKKERIHRLETVLFLLQNDFGTDVFNGTDVRIVRGSADPRGIREVGYDYIDIPGLDRTILSCDEMDNATFVFATSVLEANGIDRNQLRGMRKSQLKGLIESIPGIGQRLIHSDNFVRRIGESLDEISPTLTNQTTPNAERLVRSSSYLYPNAPEGAKSANSFSKSLGLKNPNLIHTAVKVLGEALGDIGEYRFVGQIAEGYTKEQQQIIASYLETAGYMREIPEGVISATGIEKAFKEAGMKLNSVTINKVAQEIAESLGEVKDYMFGTSLTRGYDEEQRWKILAALYERDLIGFIPTEGIMSAPALARDFGVHENTMRKAIERLGPQLGDLRKYKFASVVTLGLNPSQQSLLKADLEEHGLFVNEATEDILSLGGLEKSLHVSRKTLQLAVDALSDELGEVDRYFFGNRIVRGYTSRQQEIIRSYLESR